MAKGFDKILPKIFRTVIEFNKFTLNFSSVLKYANSPTRKNLGCFIFFSLKIDDVFCYSDIHCNGNVKALLLWLESVSYSTFWDTGVYIFFFHDQAAE